MTPGGRPGRLTRVTFAAAVAVNVAALYWPRGVSGGDVPGADKVVHLLLFAAVAATGVRAGVPVRWLAGLLAAHAVCSELAQHWLLPLRSGDPWDAVADLVGAAVGIGAAVALGLGGGSWRHDGAGGADRADRPAARRHPGPR